MTRQRADAAVRWAETQPVTEPRPDPIIQTEDPTVAGLRLAWERRHEALDLAETARRWERRFAQCGQGIHDAVYGRGWV